jgi:hypothetical protein
MPITDDHVTLDTPEKDIHERERHKDRETGIYCEGRKGGEEEPVPDTAHR